MADLYRYGETKEVYFVITTSAGAGVTGHTFSAGEVYLSIDGASGSDISSECSETTFGNGWYKWTPSSDAQTQGENLLFVFNDGTNAENRWQLQTGGDASAFHNAG